MEQELDKQIDQQIERVNVLLEAVTEFTVTYGFQIVGAIIATLLCGWLARGRD